MDGIFSWVGPTSKGLSNNYISHICDKTARGYNTTGERANNEQ
jgi:hypothetical protein